MKQLLIFALIVISLPMKAQTINGTPIDSIDTEYCQIVGTGKMFSNKVTVQLDFGQRNKWWSEKDMKLLDEQGKSLDFNSMIDALNFMSSHGWEFQTCYTITIPNGLGSYQNVYHYLLRKRKP